MITKSEQCPHHQEMFEDVVLATRDIQTVKEMLALIVTRSQADHDMLIALNAKVAAWALMGSTLGGALMHLLTKYL